MRKVETRYVLADMPVSGRLTHHLLDQKIAERGIYDVRKFRRMDPAQERKANYEALRVMLVEAGYGYKAACREAARLTRP